MKDSTHKYLRFLALFLLLIVEIGVVSAIKPDSSIVQTRKTYFPIWTFQQRNINVYGLSVGLWSGGVKPRFTNTNGVKLELIGVGLFTPIIPYSPVAQSDSAFEIAKKGKISERINGVSISSTGTACDCVVNGVSAGLVGQIQYNVNGISASGYLNFAQIHNGIQIAFMNETYKLGGFQIGIFNKSHRTKGIQIGLWNVNEKRAFPFFNWNFK